MAVAGPSKPKSKKVVEVSKEVISESESESDSGDSDNIDEVAPTPSRPAPPRKSGSQLPRYQPPPGTEPVELSVSFTSSPFEFDNLQKSGMELWAIRIPHDVKASRLSSMKMSEPGVGTLSTQSGEYVLAEADADTGAEMDGLTLLVPRVERGGKLVRAPGKIARKVILKPVERGLGEEYVVQPRVGREQPEHLLKFRNRAFGFDTLGPGATVREGESEDEDGEEKVDVKEDEEEEDKDKAERKKRKLESPSKSKDSPKKEKKRKSKA